MLPHSCLSTFQALETPFPSPAHENLTFNSSCPECAEQMRNTSVSMGCCFNLLLNTTAYRWKLAYSNETEELVYSHEFWEQYNVTVPGQCACSYESIDLSPASRAHAAGLLWTLILTSIIMLTFN